MFRRARACGCSQAGYHGAYLGDGLVAGAALQAAAALRHAMPRTLGRHVLSQIWAYKCDDLHPLFHFILFLFFLLVVLKSLSTQ